VKSIAIIAGEASGDILGSRLIIALKKIYPDARFEGIGGVEMQQQGFESIYPMERLSVMGFFEVLPRLFELLKIRKTLIHRWLDNPPDLFIGIDAPDFNFKLERTLYRAEIPTAHYVGPNLWAWREGRIKKIMGSMDVMLTLFPFELALYKKHNVNAKFVGHPLADEIPLKVTTIEARKLLDLPQDAYILAVLPGSRMSEIKHLAADFIKAAESLQHKHPDWIFVVPLINEKVKTAFNTIKQEMAPDLSLTIIDGQSRSVMSASDQILMASGTAVLEGMLIGRPMVAAYRFAPLTAFIFRLFKLMKAKYFTLPNNLANAYLVPELLQEKVTSENIVSEVEQQYDLPEKEKQVLLKHFNEIHQTLKQNASERAANVLHELLENRKLEIKNEV